MDAQQFPSHIRNLAKRIEQYAADGFPAMAVRTTLRFVDGNFRAQGWQGRGFERWMPNRRGGTILIHKGHLRRSTLSQTGRATFRVYNYSRYAAAHNRGFKGNVNIKAHTRRKYTARRVGTGRYTKKGRERTRTIHEQTGIINVKQHVRRMNVPRRQFMPESAKDSPVLVNAISRNITNSLKQIIQ